MLSLAPVNIPSHKSSAEMTEILSYMVDMIGLFFIMATSVGLGYLIHQGAGFVA